jgi:hypothetical protein
MSPRGTDELEEDGGVRGSGARAGAGDAAVIGGAALTVVDEPPPSSC